MVRSDSSGVGAIETDLGLDGGEFAEEVFYTSCAALDRLRAHCHSLGFALKKRDNKTQTTDGVATIFYYVCGRAGAYKNYRTQLTNATRVRNTSTRLCGCPFRASVRALGIDWVIQIDWSLHNHDATGNIKAHRHARLVTAEHLAMVKIMTDAGANVKTTLAAIESSDPAAVLTDRDVLNARRRVLEGELDGRTEMQALVDELQRSQVRHVMKQDANGRCTHLLLQPKQVDDLTLEFHDLVQVNSTYRTNRYNMPMVHIVGRTNTNKSFTMAVCFMRSETTADYRWSLQAFQQLVGDSVQPRTIVTDRELALVNTIAEVFPHATHIFTLPVAADTTTSPVMMTWDEFSLEWSRLVILAVDREEFELHWSKISARIPRESRHYIEHQWLTPWKTRFCAAFLRDVRHFGTLTTSRVEGCHAALKTWLPNASLSLRGVYKALKRRCARQYDTCIRERDIQLQSVPLSILGNDLFRELQNMVSHEALRIVQSEYEKAHTLTATPCNNYLQNCFGLPCSHVIREVLLGAEASHTAPRLRLNHFATHWLLDKT